MRDKGNPSLGIILAIKSYSAVFRDYIVNSVSYQKRHWQTDQKKDSQSFFWYDDKDLRAHFPMTELTLLVLGIQGYMSRRRGFIHPSSGMMTVPFPSCNTKVSVKYIA